MTEIYYDTQSHVITKRAHGHARSKVIVFLWTFFTQSNFALKTVRNDLVIGRCKIQSVERLYDDSVFRGTDFL